MKPGESITVTIDKGNGEIGHVVIISKDENGNVVSASDFNQTNKTYGWKTYKNHQNMKFKVFSDPKKLPPPEPQPPPPPQQQVANKDFHEAARNVLPSLKKVITEDIPKGFTEDIPRVVKRSFTNNSKENKG